MANEDHVSLLTRGVKIWNWWREVNPDIEPDLRGASLSGIKLCPLTICFEEFNDCITITANLAGVNLCGADLSYAQLAEVNFSGAELEEANFDGTQLAKANFSGANLKKAKLRRAGLWKANFSKAILGKANFAEAELNASNFNDTILRNACFHGANLTDANLAGVELKDVNLVEARLVRADLSRANLTGAYLTGCRLDKAKLDGVICLYLKDSQHQKIPRGRNFDPGEFARWCQEKQDRDTRFIPTSIMLEKDKPEENLRNLAKLIDVLQIEAVFDPYLDDEALSNLLRIASLGVSFAPNLRILSSKDPNRSPRFTQLRIQNFFRTLSISGEVRKLPKDEQHRRFMLLNDGSSLIIGCSLNDVSKDEKARVEFDREDRMFFDSMWSSAQRIDERSS